MIDEPRFDRYCRGYRELPGGRELSAQQRIFNTILTIGSKGSPFIDDFW